MKKGKVLLIIYLIKSDEWKYHFWHTNNSICQRFWQSISRLLLQVLFVFDLNYILNTKYKYNIGKWVMCHEQQYRGSQKWQRRFDVEWNIIIIASRWINTKTAMDCWRKSGLFSDSYLLLEKHQRTYSNWYKWKSAILCKYSFVNLLPNDIETISSGNCSHEMTECHSVQMNRMLKGFAAAFLRIFIIHLVVFLRNFSCSDKKKNQILNNLIRLMLHVNADDLHGNQIGNRQVIPRSISHNSATKFAPIIHMPAEQYMERKSPTKW